MRDSESSGQVSVQVLPCWDLIEKNSYLWWSEFKKGGVCPLASNHNICKHDPTKHAFVGNALAWPLESTSSLILLPGGTLSSPPRPSDPSSPPSRRVSCPRPCLGPPPTPTPPRYLGVKGRGYARQELVLMSIVGAVLTVKAEIHYVIHDSLPFAEGTGGQFKAVEPPHIVEQLPPQVAVMAVIENEQEGVFMKQINTLRPDVRYVERHEIKPQRDAKAVVKLVMKSLIFLDGTQTRDARVRQRIDEVKAERYLMDEVAITAKKAKRRLGIDDGNTGDEFDSELDV
ncbi:hypothetical protein C8J57DRAFT_1227700 [Mycena rebaudengoi]|nr:hypothetical protein C8J57DRAFT_1227700 [Mycena rebaudengoi]